MSKQSEQMKAADDALFCLIGYSGLNRPLVVCGKSLRLRESLWRMGRTVDCVPRQEGLAVKRAWQNDKVKFQERSEV